MGNFKIISINFSRFRKGDKILQVINSFKNEEIDIWCLQEIDIDSVIKFLGSKFKVFVNWDIQSNSKYGIATLLKWDLKLMILLWGGKEDFWI